MRASECRGERGRRWLVAFLVLVIGVILFAGLAPKGFRFRNGVEWSGTGAGLSFDGVAGVAFSDPFLRADAFSAQEGLTIDLVLRLGSLRTSGFSRILTIHDGIDADQLLVGQWQNSLIVMNGDDYSYRLRHPRVSAALAEGEGTSVRLTITSDARDGTVLLVDGEERGRNPELVLRVPGREEGARVILGSSPDGRRAWHGEIHRLAIYAAVLRSDSVQDSDGERQAGHSVALYRMAEGEGRRTRNESSSRGQLRFPLESTFVTRQAFRSGVGRGLLVDVVVNILGFVPLGMVLIMLLPPGKPAWHAVLLVMVAGSVLSFGIEWLQSWMPTRTSSVLDLVLNVAGTGLGAVLVVVFRSGAGRASVRPKP